MVIPEVDQRKTARFPCLKRLRDREGIRTPSDGKMYHGIPGLALISRGTSEYTALNPALAEVREA